MPAPCGSVLLAIAPPVAAAKPFKVTLEYVAGPGCPGMTEFKAIVAGRLGYNPFAPDAPDRVLVQVVPRQGSIEGRLEWRDASGAWTGDQTFPTASTDCMRFARVVGFALAVQIQLLANVRPDPEASMEPRRATRTCADRFTAGVRTARRRCRRSSRRRPRWPHRAACRVRSSRWAPAPWSRSAWRTPRSCWGGIFGVLAWTHVAIELAAQTSVPVTTRRADGSGFSQQHLLLGAAGCAVFTRWTACLLANAGEVRLSGVDIDRPTSALPPSSRPARAWAPSIGSGVGW